jgi:hypothetical protein
MRPRIDAPEGRASPNQRPVLATPPERLCEVEAVAELFLGIFRRDLAAFFPHLQFLPAPLSAPNLIDGPGFDFIQRRDGSADLCLFQQTHRLIPRHGMILTPQDGQLIRAIGSVLGLRYHHLFHLTTSGRLELYRGGSEDHYIAAFIEPWAYEPSATRPSRIAQTILTLRTAALSTYENHRVSTGALLLGRDDPEHPFPKTPDDALPYGVELTGLKSIHRLCDGKRTLFAVDAEGRLSAILDIARFANELTDAAVNDVPCARAYQAHAHATRAGGHVCVVLSPNQEIKLFAEGRHVFAFAHGRWRILDPAAKFAMWNGAVKSPALARSIFQAALNLSENRQGALFVVVDEPRAALGRLIASHDFLSTGASAAPPSEFSPHDPLAKRALHYLARGQNIVEMDPAVLEALASLDGAIATDRNGRLLAFGAILRQQDDLPGLAQAEGARTTAALVASRYGPVLKVSEDGVVSCYLNGERVWDL